VARGRLAIAAKVESGLRIHVRMTPTIQDDARDVLGRIEAGAAEQPHHLLADLPLVFLEAGGEQLGAAANALLMNGKDRIVERDVEGQQDRLVGIERRPIIAHDHWLPNVAAEAEAVEPPAGGDAERIKKAPVGQRDVNHEEWRVMKLPARLSVV